MNIGLGMVLLVVAAIMTLIGLRLQKQKKTAINQLVLVVGAVMFIAGLLLVVGIIDPYSSHLN